MFRKSILALAAVAALGTVAFTPTTADATWYGKGWYGNYGYGHYGYGWKHYRPHYGFYNDGFYGPRFYGPRYSYGWKKFPKYRYRY